MSALPPTKPPVSSQTLVPDPSAAEAAAQLPGTEQKVAELTVASVILALLVRRFRAKAPTWIALIVDVLPIAWMYGFALTLVEVVSDLIPARKDASRGFTDNAVASAGLMAFAVALLPRRWRGVGGGALGLVLSFLGMADVLHMRIFGNVMPVGSHGSLTQLWDVRASIVSLFESQDKWILMHVATAAAMLAFWRVKKIDNLRIARVIAYLVPIGALATFPARVSADVSGFLASKWAREVLNREDQVWNAGFLEAHVREISLNTKHWLEHRRPTSAEIDQVEAYYKEEHSEHYTANLPSFGKYKGKNLLVIQIEAFEEWLIGATVNGQTITPNLNKLLDRGLYYPNIFNLVATTPTADCEYLMLNSNHPLPDGAVAFRRESNHFVTLATALRDAGYSTVSMHGYRHGMWNRAVLHPRYGFTHSLFAEELGMTPQIGWGLDDHALADDVAVQVTKEPSPWFVYAITLSSHHPYGDIPYDRRRLKLGPLERTMVGEYMHSAAFVDDAIGQLFQKLEAQGILKDTIVVLYGDHDGHLHATPRDRANLAAVTNLPKSKSEYIGAGGAAGADDKTDAARFWYRNRIPLIILLPGMDAPQVARVYGAQIDFAPTILHYLGIDPPRSFMGHPILPEDTGGFVARWDGSFVSPPLIYDAGLDQCRVLSDLRVIPAPTCRALADKARKQLDMSWLVTNNDLARRLVDHAQPIEPAPKPAAKGAALGGACQEEKDCVAPDGFDVHCLGGVCITDPHAPCARPGSTEPCALGSACYPYSSDLTVCAADCDTYACAGKCNDVNVCASRP